ncbi:MAG TPA: DUF92 domain-containing protein [Thermoplasmata archaeon]|nr:DUF92 domain-containing protein [Thermoplasmata archaeon]
MVLPLLLAAVGVAATAGLASAAVAARALTSLAGLVAAVFGAIIVVFGGFPYLILLVLFVVGSVLATRYGFEEKARAKLQEGTRGERGISNVLAHIVIPTALVVTSFVSPDTLSAPALAVAYTAALAFGSADTFASEFGVLVGRARSILTFRRVPPGTNGGVSVVGEVWAIVGAAATAVVGLVLFFVFGSPDLQPASFLAISLLAGFTGCQIDSVMGELLENRGLLTKGTTNFFAMLATVVLALVLLAVLGVPL